MKPILLAVTATLAFAPALYAQHGHHPAPATPASASDSAFARVQQRGRDVMGVDQATSRHVFTSLADGGTIMLTRLADDSAGTAQIRAHLREIATMFARGDFTAPFLVHDHVVPGTAMMTARKSMIRYEVRDAPRGAELRITTTDPEAVAAIHEFLEFQRMDHRSSHH